MTIKNEGTQHEIMESANKTNVGDVVNNNYNTPEQSKQNNEAKEANVIKKVQALLEAEITKLFHDNSDTGYAVINKGDRKEVHPIQSRMMKRLTQRLAHRAGLTLSDTQVKQILSACDSVANFDGDEEICKFRVSRFDNEIEIDLNNCKGQCVSVNKNGWSLTSNPQSYFLRSDTMGELPLPTSGDKNHIYDLYESYFHPKRKSDVLLLVTLMTYCLRETNSYPLLVLRGEKGSGKSSATMMIKSLVDPDTATKAALPKNEQELFIAANERHLVSFDNVSNIKAYLSDALCRIATGGTYRTRDYYTVFDSVSKSLAKPILMNGIPDFVNKSDLISRSVVIELESIENIRLSDDELHHRFSQDSGEMFGLLLDCLSYSLSHFNDLDISGIQTRFPDFAKIGVAVERYLDMHNGAFKEALEANQKSVIIDNLNHEPVAMALWRYLTGIESDKVEITGQDLLENLSRFAGREEHSRKWPSQAQHLSKTLNELSSDLKEIGIKFERDRATNQRKMVLTKLESFKPYVYDGDDGHDDERQNFSIQSIFDDD